MKADKNSRKYYLVFIYFLIYSFCVNLYGGDPFIKLPNGETKYLTDTEPVLYITKENGKVTSIKSLNLEEELDIIVSFKSKPLCLQERSVRLSKTMEITSEHDAFKSELNRITELFQKKMKKTQSQSQDYSLKHEYYRAFNGISLSCKRGVAEMIRTLPMVENVYQDREVKINLDKSVPQIRADRVRNELGLTGEGVLVGIVDTGIDYMHPALGEGFGPTFRVIGGYDFINEDADPVDDHSHGTHLAGIVGASSDALMGVAPGVHFIAAKVLDEDGGGWMSTVLAGIDYCMDPDGNPGTNDAVDVMNLSLGSYPQPDDPLEIAVNNASESGILSVVAAGNSGSGDPSSPSGFETIGSPGTAEKALTVGACDSEFKLADFSSKGPDPIHFRIKPEIVAPGVAINSSVLSGETEKYSGTSMATPHVVGVAALIKQQHPDWTPEEIKWAIVNSATPLDEEEYNPYRQGTGCVDAWNAAHQDIIVQPGVLSFGMVDLELAVWKDTVSFTIKNTGAQSQQVLFNLDDLPAAVQLNLSQSSVTLGPGEEQSLTAEVVVPSSVPIVEEDPFAYFGSLLCISGAETVNIPFGFTKANILVVEYDIAPYFILLYGPNSIDNKFVWGLGAKKFHIKYHQGSYNILTSMHLAEDTTVSTYYVQRKDVKIGGLTYQTISHEEAEFYAFPGPIYDINNNIRTDEDLLDRVFNITISQSQDTLNLESSIFGTGKNFYLSQLDSSLTFDVIGLWKPIDDILVLNYQIRGIENAEDLIPPSGSENLTSCNFHFCELNENLIVPGLPEKEDTQIIWWNHYKFDGGGKRRTSIGCDFEKIDFSKISFLKTPTSFNPDQFYSISLGMIRENRWYSLGDLWTDENGQIIIFERPGLRDLISEQMIQRYVVGSNDTLQFNPGEEIYLPAIDNFYGYNKIIRIENFLRYSVESAISPINVFEDSRSRRHANQPIFNYYLYNNAQANQMVLNYLFMVYNFQMGTRYRIQGNTRNYYLLGQNGHTTIDYEFYLPEGNDVRANPPNIDQLIVLSGGKPAQWLRPSGDDNKIRLLFYDANHDIDQIQCFLIPSSGEKISLDLEIDQEKREVFASIPDDLPHEYIDVEVMVTDLSGNQTILTAAPAFFYGNSLEERVYDSRVYMVKYNLENPEQFPFSAGDSLSLNLDFISNGNVSADSIMIVYPTTAMFAPAGPDTVFIDSLAVGDSTTINLNLEVLQTYTEDEHYVYTPEIHWKTNGKSYMRTYPVYIKTWQPEDVSSIHPEPEMSTKLTYQLYCNYPNPFNLSTTIGFQIPKRERVKIAIYNILGQHVKTLVDQMYQKGNYKIVWDGSNRFGETVASGIYFVRIVAGDFVRSKKMVLLK